MLKYLLVNIYLFQVGHEVVIKTIDFIPLQE